MKLRVIFSILAVFFLCVFEHYIIYNGIFEPLFGDKNHILSTFFIFISLITFLGFFLIPILPQFIRRIPETILFTWIGALFILFLLCLFAIPIEIYFSQMAYPQKTLSFYLLIVGITMILYALFQALRKPSIVSTTVPLPSSIPPQIENLSVVVLSDIHVSGLIGRRKMTSLAQRVNKLEPDFIFITGDLMDGSLKNLIKEIEPLKNLKAKKDIIYITGNHEYYSGPLEWKNHFGNYFNWHVLSNSSKTIDVDGVTINILGIEDKHWLHYEKIPRKQDQRLNTSVEHLRQELRSLDKSPQLENCLNILLAHQPKDAKYLRSYPWINLQISGHTHGGQIWPLKFLVIKDQKYNVGLYKIRHNQYIYVNQGTGFWGPPMRLGTRCEITHMKFKRQQHID